MVIRKRNDNGGTRRSTALRIVLGILILAAVAAGGFGGWLISLPGQRQVAEAQPIPRQEHQAALQKLRPRSGKRPVIAIIGINDATETTDFLMPYGILRRADVADVMSVATNEGPVKLYPALSVLPDASISTFDKRFPQGADYVIVPAMSREDDPAALKWIREQAGKGATIIGVCIGSKVVANSGLLENRRATTHWYALNSMLKEHPSIIYVPDRRFVVEQGVATTTGISASMPMMVTLIEAIAGADRARAVAKDLGIATWDARYRSGAFGLSRPFVSTVMRNRAAWWNHERLAIELEGNVDEVSLALMADAWSRTYRSQVQTFAMRPEPVVTQHGARILPDEVVSSSSKNDVLPTITGLKPATTLDLTLKAISNRYGQSTARIVAAQLEYPYAQ